MESNVNMTQKVVCSSTRVIYSDPRHHYLSAGLLQKVSTDLLLLAFPFYHLCLTYQPKLSAHGSALLKILRWCSTLLRIKLKMFTMGSRKCPSFDDPTLHPYFSDLSLISLLLPQSPPSTVAFLLFLK